MTRYVLAIDQGTTSTRAIVFDHSGLILSVGQQEHEQIFPRAGWAEHAPRESAANPRAVVGQALAKASRTMLMDLDTLSWDADIAGEMGVPLSMLPHIRSSSEEYGTGAGGALNGVPIAGILGDQQAATFGQVCYEVGTAKNTYGT